MMLSHRSKFVLALSISAILSLSSCVCAQEESSYENDATYGHSTYGFGTGESYATDFKTRELKAKLNKQAAQLARRKNFEDGLPSKLYQKSRNIDVNNEVLRRYYAEKYLKEHEKEISEKEKKEVKAYIKKSKARAAYLQSLAQEQNEKVEKYYKGENERLERLTEKNKARLYKEHGLEYKLQKSKANSSATKDKKNSSFFQN